MTYLYRNTRGECFGYSLTSSRSSALHTMILYLSGISSTTPTTWWMTIPVPRCWVSNSTYLLSVRTYCAMLQIKSHRIHLYPLMTSHGTIQRRTENLTTKLFCVCVRLSLVHLVQNKLCYNELGCVLCFLMNTTICCIITFAVLSHPISLSERPLLSGSVFAAVYYCLHCWMLALFSWNNHLLLLLRYLKQWYIS